MSILIEALSIVIPRSVLDARHPNGSRGYIDGAVARGVPFRYALADEHIVVMSVLAPDVALEEARQLAEHGIVIVDERECDDGAFVDQYDGPTAPCAWLRWERDPRGHSCAWHADAEKGELIAPLGWTPDRWQTLQPFDPREEPGRAMLLARESGVETWIDFRTGHLIATSAEPVAPRGPIFRAVLAPLDQLGWASLVRARASVVDWSLTMRSATFVCSATVDEDARSLVVRIWFPDRVPPDRRAAAGEFALRANCRLSIGSVELDPESGAMCVRTGCCFQGTESIDAMIRNLVHGGIYLAEFLHDGAKSVVQLGTDPAEAVRRLESSR